MLFLMERVVYYGFNKQTRSTCLYSAAALIILLYGVGEFMKFPKRKPTRWQEYDYSQNGRYFLTIYVKDKLKILCKKAGVSAAHTGEIIILSDIGLVVDTAIKNIPNYYTSVIVDKYVIMPNHIHIILILQAEGSETMFTPKISNIILQLKAYVTKQIGFSIWQELSYDRVIRDEIE